MLSSTKKRMYSMLGTALFLVTTLVIYATLIQPEYSGIQILRGQLESKQKSFEEQRKIVLKVQELLAKSASNLNKKNIISLSFPVEENTSELVNQVQAISRDNGLSLTALNINTLTLRPSEAPITIAKSVGTLQISARLIGPYQPIKKFLEQIENNIRIMDVVGFKIDTANNQNQNVYLADVLINAYYQSKR